MARQGAGGPSGFPGRPLQVGLLLLAGGHSRRMGSPKALLPVAGTTLIEWQVARLAGAFTETLISVASLDQLPPSLRELAVVDRRGDQGPLGGLAAGLERATPALVFALAVDMPRVSPALPRFLHRRLGRRDAAVPRSPRGPEPLGALYRRDPALAAALGALEAAELRMSAFLERLDVAYVDAAPHEELENLNSPADYRAFLGRERP